MTEKFIRIYNLAGGSTTYSVHDFLMVAGISLDHSTQVHYVGITKNPDTRPLNRQHRGVSDTLYTISNEENDFFLIVNLFKVTSLTTTGSYGMFFILGNGLSDEVPVKPEGGIIEGGFVAYFDSPIQKEKRSPERAILEKELKRVRSDLNIDYVIFDFQLDRPSDYFRLSSDKIAPSDRHVFRCATGDNGLVVENLPSDFDVNRYLMEKLNE